ncbi:MAG: portal protein [Candidatus Pacebacteria bacterium]|nr:portal protein [Candidatus Paceibacterota bacterium]
MPFELFGFSVSRPVKDKKRQDRVKSFAPPAKDDGAIVVAEGGAFGTYVNMDGAGKLKNEAQLITKYRALSLQPEAELAIDDIVNEAIVMQKNAPPIEINLDDLEQPKKIKDKIKDEFEHIMQLLDFNNEGYDIFKRWYVDGRLYYHIMIDEQKPRKGIMELRYIDPRKIRKIRQEIPDKTRMIKGSVGNLSTHFNKKVNEFFVYNEQGLVDNPEGLKISKDSICYVTSGLIDERAVAVLSHLHKALKPMNVLRWMEDAVAIYRISRAPERRIFYIDVGNLPKMKAEQYLRDMMVKHKNKLVYDSTTGEVRDDRKFMTMLEDFWLPRREGGKGTEISTLPGGQNLGEIEDIQFFLNKLYKALNVPVSRLDTENSMFNIGRASEITRDELKFSKFVNRIRSRFSILFDELLETQLILKGVTNKKDWKTIKEQIHYDFKRDNYFEELKNHEMLRGRFEILTEVDNYIGRYFSIEWVKKQILMQTDDDIEDMDKQMKIEKGEGEDGEDNDDNFGSFGGAEFPAGSPAPASAEYIPTGPELKEVANTKLRKTNGNDKK